MNSNKVTDHIIRPLSQDDLARGWRLIAPKIRHFKNTPSENNEGNKRTSNLYHSKVNLAQLPYHLWHKVTHIKMKWIYDKSHVYHYESTNVDNEIRELVKILNNPFDIKNKEYVTFLLNTLSDNNVNGWPIIKAKHFYK
jgi:hypothetical protein